MVPCSQLSKLIKRLLEAYPHSVKADQTALQGPDLTPNARLALRYRVREMRTLEAALGYIKRRKACAMGGGPGC